jgi:hypothetical protein
MATWKSIAILAAVTGCAGAQTARQRDLAAGHWIGEIDRGGWPQPLSLDFERDNGAYRGQWSTEPGVRSKPLESVEIQGDEVRFETDKLRFVGHVAGTTLSGTVSQKAADAPLGEFSVTQEPEAYSPGSEWAPPTSP